MSVIREGEDLILQLRYTQSVWVFDPRLTAACFGPPVGGCLFHTSRQLRDSVVFVFVIIVGAFCLQVLELAWMRLFSSFCDVWVRLFSSFAYLITG